MGFCRRYGLMGPNGKGKSTLMKMLAKRQIPVPANIGGWLRCCPCCVPTWHQLCCTHLSRWPGGETDRTVRCSPADVMMVEQEVVGDDRTAIEAVMQADLELMQLKAEEEEITK